MSLACRCEARSRRSLSRSLRMPRLERSLLSRQSVACLACWSVISFGLPFSYAQACAAAGAMRAAAATRTAAALRMAGMGQVSSGGEEPLKPGPRPHTSGQGPTLEAMTKRCGRCRVEKPVESFHRRRGGYQTWCKECRRTYDARYHQSTQAVRVEQKRERHAEFV